MSPLSTEDITLGPREDFNIACGAADDHRREVHENALHASLNACEQVFIEGHGELFRIRPKADADVGEALEGCEGGGDLIDCYFFALFIVKRKMARFLPELILQDLQSTLETVFEVFVRNSLKCFANAFCAFFSKIT